MVETDIINRFAKRLPSTSLQSGEDKRGEFARNDCAPPTKGVSSQPRDYNTVVEFDFDNAERIIQITERVESFYRSNPGSLLRAHDLCYVIGASEPEIAAACESLRERGVLVGSKNDVQRIYRLQRG